jgi:ArsR family transcriptional regulator
MASVHKSRPASPREAARRRDPLDRLLAPELFKVLSDPTRTRLLACLLRCGRPCSVTEVAECCAVDFSAVARHLATLARAGLASAEKRGRTVWYRAEGEFLAGHLTDLAAAIAELGSLPGCCEGER